MVHTEDVIRQLKATDTSDFPDFESYNKPLERGLWALWVAKDKLKIKRLSTEQIASIIREVKEISVDANSIAKAFSRAGDKVHRYREKGVSLFEIMKPGKAHLMSLATGETVEAFYFEPGRKYSAKRMLTGNILATLGKKLRVVDPYCGERTLDILGTVKDGSVKFLTRLENLRDKDRQKFLRELRDFKSENPGFEFKSYPQSDLHDRYIIAPDSLVLLGHSLKDLGSKESFAVVLKRDTNRNVIEALTDSFDKRWAQSTAL